MPGLLLIAHAPLASALKAVAEHTFPNCAPQLAVLDVTPDMGAEDVELAARKLMDALGHDDWVVLTDVPGATPHNGALRLAGAGRRVRVVTGLNVPMLWRSLCYGQSSLDELAQRAVEGGHKCIETLDLQESTRTPQ